MTTPRRAREVLARAIQTHGELTHAGTDYHAAAARRREAVREAHYAGWSMGEIADALGITKSAVQQVIERKDGE